MDPSSSHDTAPIPEQVRELPLIRVCRPECQSHEQCSSPGKRPLVSTTNDESVREVERWISEGGNYGIVARDSNDLVVFDSDSVEFSGLLDEHLPATFTVKSGGDGHGRHYYYRCSEAERQSGWTTPEGSVRVRNWHVVGPGSTHPDTENEYQIVDGRQIAPLTQGQLQAVYESLDDRDAAVKSGGGGGSGADPAAAASSHSDRLDFIRRDDKRRDIANVLSGNSSHEERVWMVGWLHGAAGLEAQEIVDIILAEATWPNLDRDVVEDQVESVIRSSRSERGTHYSKFGTADMDAPTSERRKTESGDATPDNQEVTTHMASNDDRFTTKEKAIEYNDDGEAVQARLIEGTDEDTGEKFEYVDVATGQVEQIETVDGETVKAPQINDDPGQTTSLGSPERLELKIEALQELKESLE